MSTTALRDHSSSPSCLRDLCVERRVDQLTIEAVFAPAQLFSRQWIPTSLQILQMAALVMVPS